MLADWKKGIGVISMYERSNILALVGGGPHPRFLPTHVVVWDDFQNRQIAELQFSSNVLNVQVRRERIVVVLETSIYVYNFMDLTFIGRFSTFANPTGEVCLSMGTPITIVYPAQAQGHMAVHCEDPGDPSGTKIQPRQTIAAHNGPIACIALSMDGKFAATASDKGTLIRVWDTTTCRQVREFRRGADNAQIYSICFSPDNTLLAVSSSKGTCHIFAIQESVATNRQSSLSSIGGFLPAYFRSSWSSMQAEISSQRTTLAFAPDKSFVYVLCQDGTFSRISIEWGDSVPTAKIDPSIGRYSLFE